MPNPCLFGPGGGEAGGVGWLINPSHRNKIKRTISSRADGEGTHMMRVTASLPGGQEIDMASVYIPPSGSGTHDGKSKIRELVINPMQAKHARGEPMVVMGDINCDVRKGGEEAECWAAALSAAEMTDLTLEGHWAHRDTRFPLGKQKLKQKPSHIGMMAIYQSVVGATGATLMSIGSGSELDTGDKPLTDHKLISARLKLSRRPLVPKRPDKKIYKAHEASKKDNIKAVVEDHLKKTWMWTDAVETLRASPGLPDDIECAQLAMAAALCHTAEETVGSKILPGEKGQKVHT